MKTCLFQHADSVRLLEKLVKKMSKMAIQYNLNMLLWEGSGSVVECLTRDRGAAGSSLTGVTELWSLSKTHLS